MIKARHCIFLFCVIASIFLLQPCPASADDMEKQMESSPVTSPDEDTGLSLAGPDVVDDEEAPQEFHNAGDAFAGYRVVGVKDSGGNAAVYDYLHSGIIGGMRLMGVGNDLQYSVEGKYINENDYVGDFLYDYQSRYFLHLRTESLFHHTWHNTLGPSFSTATSTYTLLDEDPSAHFGLRAEQDLLQFRYKLPEYPMHLNIGYWRLVRGGKEQQIYSDQDFGINSATAANTIYSFGRVVDRETNEGRVGFDTHLGPIDVVYSFLIRDFYDKAGTPRNIFATRLPGQSFAMEHNEDPDSRYTAHTAKVHTSLDGGITAGISYTIGERRNRSALTDFTGIGNTTSTLHNLAGDFNFIPCGSFSLAIKYRRQDVDRSVPTSIVATFPGVQPFTVRPAFSTSRDIVTATMSFRPIRATTLKAEYRADYTHREFQESADQALNWHRMADSSLTHTGTFAILSRPAKPFRVKAQYSYATTDQPEYANSPETRHEGEFLATYTRSSWGATARYLVKKDDNDNLRQVVRASSAPLSFQISPLSSRSSAQNDGTFSVWVSPVQGITLTGTYGLIQLKTDQGVLFTSGAVPVHDVANYTSRAHFYSINATYGYNEKLNLSLELQQIRSSAQFSPEPLTVSATSDTSGIGELSRLKTVESALLSRIDYQFSRLVSCFLEYSYRDYDDKFGAAADGTAQVVMAAVQARW